jgi:two-component system sensor histidine kinase VicK
MLTRADYNFVVKYGEVTPDGVAVYDLNTRKFVYVNRFLRDILGMAERETLEAGDSVLKFVHPDDMEFVEHHYRELLSIGCMGAAEFRVLRPDSQVRNVSAEVLWLEESYTFALFVKDVTTFRKHEEFVVKISAQKDTLLDMLLHNLSGPLHLSHDLIAAMRKENGDGEHGRLLNIIADTTAHCIGIIQQFLQNEHAESTNVVVRRSRFSIREKILFIVELVKELNPEKQISFVCEPENSFVISDPVKYCQIVHNIISNAVKYTEDGGQIGVFVSGADHTMAVSVSDDGVGVAAQLRDQLFVQKVSGFPGLKGEPSNGTGLFLCRRLSDLIGGKLTYEPRDQGGSLFTFSIPRE